MDDTLVQLIAANIAFVGTHFAMSLMPPLPGAQWTSVTFLFCTKKI